MVWENRSDLNIITKAAAVCLQRPCRMDEMPHAGLPTLNTAGGGSEVSTITSDVTGSIL